jgi:general secretion pathway protein K
MKKKQGSQRGAALLIALLTVTLVASLSAAALWQQWRSVQIESAERARVQALWVLNGARDWARLILREDVREGSVDHLGEPWAIPLEEARLSTFLAADKNNNSSADTSDMDLEQVFLSGSVTDLQSRMNVLNLVEDGAVSKTWFKAFAKLYAQLGLDEAELNTVTDNLRLAQAPQVGKGAPSGTNSTTTPLLPQRVGQLRWLGMSERSLKALTPFITVLPARTSVNLNTASATVLSACIPSLDMAQAQNMVEQRQSAYFRNLGDAGRSISAITAELSNEQHGVSTRFFEVKGRLRMGETVIEERSLVQREGLNNISVLRRERGTQ